MVAARKKTKQRMKAAPMVMNSTGVNCENTLKPWMTFIRLAIPDSSNPEANVKLNKNAVIIYFIILFISLNSDLLITNPITNNNTPTPIVI